MITNSYSKGGRSCRVKFSLVAGVSAESVHLCGDFKAWDRASLLTCPPRSWSRPWARAWLGLLWRTMGGGTAGRHSRPLYASDSALSATLWCQRAVGWGLGGV